jgi:hypothetical protein
MIWPAAGLPFRLEQLHLPSDLVSHFSFAQRRTFSKIDVAWFRVCFSASWIMRLSSRCLDWLIGFCSRGMPSRVNTCLRVRARAHLRIILTSREGFACVAHANNVILLNSGREELLLRLAAAHACTSPENRSLTDCYFGMACVATNSTLWNQTKLYKPYQIFLDSISIWPVDRAFSPLSIEKIVKKLKRSKIKKALGLFLLKIFKQDPLAILRH